MAQVQILQVNLNRFLNDPSLAPQRDLERRARNVLADAIEHAPVDRSGRTDLDHPAGQLRDSLTFRFTMDKGKRVARVFSTAEDRDGEPYAKHVILGTEPHEISGGAGGVRFQWTNPPRPRAGHFRNKVYRFPRVFHPGTEPNDFLRNALRAALR